MADVLNLNRARKRKRRQEDRAQADANAMKHGRTKAARKLDEAQRALDEAKLDGAKREPTPPPDADDS